MASVIDRLKVVITGDATQLQAALRRVSANMLAAGRSIRATGSTLSARLTVPTLLAGAVVSKLGVDFDDEMTKIETLVGVAGNQVALWRRQILALGPAVGRGPSELARAMFAVTSAGARGAAALEILTRAAKASAVGLGDTREVALAVTAAMQAYQKSGLTAAQATDTLIATVREGNLEASELAGSLGRVIGIASEVGVSFQEVGSFIATFTRVGVSAEEAVTALRGVITTFIKPSEEAKKVLQELGLSAEVLRQRIGDQGLARTLMELLPVLQQKDEALAAVIPNVRALAGVLSTAGSQGEDYLAITEKLTDSTGALGTAFERTAESPGFKLRQLLAQLQVAGTRLATQVIPVVLKAAGIVSRLVTAFTQLNPAVQQAVLLGFGLGAALGPALLIIGGLVSAFGLLISAMNPVGLAIAALTAIVLGMRNNWLGMGEAGARAWEAIVEVADRVLPIIGNIVKPVINGVIGAFVGLARVAGVIWEDIKERFRGVFDFMLDWGGRVLGAIGRGFVALGRLAASAVDAITGAVEEAAEGAEEEGASLGSKIAAALVESFGTDYVGAFLGFVRQGIQRAKALIERVIARLRTLVGGAEHFGAELRALEDAALGLGNIEFPELDLSGPKDDVERFRLDLKKEALRAGEDFIGGFIEGTLNLADFLRRTISHIAQAFVIGVLKQELKIASPSAVTMQLGKATGMGIALGLLSTRSPITARRPGRRHRDGPGRTRARGRGLARRGRRRPALPHARQVRGAGARRRRARRSPRAGQEQDPGDRRPGRARIVGIPPGVGRVSAAREGAAQRLTRSSDQQPVPPRGGLGSSQPGGVLRVPREVGVRLYQQIPGGAAAAARSKRLPR